MSIWKGDAVKVHGGQFVVSRQSEKPGFWVLEMRKRRKGVEKVVASVELPEHEITRLRAEETADNAIRKFATRESPQKDKALWKYLPVRTEPVDED